MEYLANDLEHHWMPFTANRDFKADPRLVVRAEGAYYWNHWGDKVFDGLSGLFCVPAGHGRPEIVDAVAEQLKTLDYGSPFQLGHPLSFELSLSGERIVTDTGVREYVAGERRGDSD